MFYQFVRIPACALCAALLFSCDDGATPSHPLDAGAADSSVSYAGGEKVDRSGLGDVGTGAPLDYQNPAYWLCRPGMVPNECHRDLDATEIKLDGSLEVVKHERAQQPEFDCFYIYPTVLINQGAQMTDFTEAGVTLTLDALLVQAARFNRICEVYAPLYRQTGLVGGAPAPSADMKQSMQDVRDAFAYYLEHYNHGRNFVLIGHSQGTFMLESMIRRDLDEKPELRARLISALLIGGQPYVSPGQTVGGSFKHLAPCKTRAQTGCVIAYNSFAAESPPTATSLLGRVATAFANDPVDPNGQVMCVNPADISGNTGRYAGSYFPVELYNAAFGAAGTFPDGVKTPFVLYRDLLRGECATEAGANYLKITAEVDPKDQRTPPVYRNAAFEAFGFGLHVVDFNLTLEDLIDAVRQQAEAMR